MWLLLAFIAVPLIEIALFIQVGGLIGLWPTLAVVLVTAVVGTLLVRSQGASVMTDLRRSFNEMQDPAEPLAHGAMILFAGALLLTPGFFTDAVGFALLLPPLRRMAWRWIRARMHVDSVVFAASETQATRTRPGDRVIDGEWQEVSTERRPTDRSSGWTRH